MIAAVGLFFAVSAYSIGCIAADIGTYEYIEYSGEAELSPFSSKRFVKYSV